MDNQSGNSQGFVGQMGSSVNKKLLTEAQANSLQDFLSVRMEEVRKEVMKEQYHHFPESRTTICLITMRNGFEVTGVSHCINAAEFSLDKGQKFALQDAMEEARNYEVYMLKQKVMVFGDR